MVSRGSNCLRAACYCVKSKCRCTHKALVKLGSDACVHIISTVSTSANIGSKFPRSGVVQLWESGSGYETSANRPQHRKLGHVVAIRTMHSSSCR